MNRLIGLVLAGMVWLGALGGWTLGPGASSAGASSGISTIIDPVGDTNPQAASYQDVTLGSLSKRGTSFQFVQQVAGPVPAAPQLPSSVVLMSWCWGMDTNPATDPKGYPLAPGTANPLEYLACVLWDGTTFSAELFDRTPLLTGGQAVVTPVPFTVSGQQLSVSVDEGLMDKPSTFAWDTGTENRHSPIPSNGFQELDFAGDGTWPA